MRKLIVVGLACSVFGGVIGALVIAATVSRASPEAVAAAVQRVEDRPVERQLLMLNRELDARFFTRRTLGGAVRRIADNVRLICRATARTPAFCE